MRNFLALTFGLSAILFTACSGIGPLRSGMDYTVEVYGLSEDGLEAATSTGPGLNFPVYKAEFENGLTAIISPNHTLPIFSFYTFFDVGGRYEGEGTTGATHFLEHMMFKGAQKYGPGEFDTSIEASGGRTNAYTTFDSTVYYQHLPSHMLNRIIDMEADRMTDVLLNPQMVESERHVIFNERKMRYENSPRGMLFLGMMQNFFKGTPYGGSVIGEVEDLESLTRDQLKEFFHKFYTPDNAIIVIVGDVDPDRTFREIARRYSHLEPSDEDLLEYKAEKDDPKHYQRETSYGEHIRLTGSSPEPMFALAYAGEPLGEERGYVLDFLASILASGESSYFYQQFVSASRPQLTQVNASHYALKHDGIFFVMGSLLPGVSLDRFKNNLITQGRRACSRAIDDRAVQKIKNQILVSFYSGLSTNDGLAHFLGRREYFYGDFRAYRDELKAYNSITTQDVRQACREIFESGRYIFVSVQQD